MTGEVENGIVAARLVVIRIGDHGARVVGHDQLRNAADEVQRPARGIEPVRHGFTRRGAGKGIAGGAQGRDKDVSPPASDQRDGRAGKVDEELLASAMDLAHRAFELLGETTEILAELRIDTVIPVKRFAVWDRSTCLT